jgi:hypothetical protein
MADLVKSTSAAVRAADTLLRAAGGRTVLLRLPAPGIPADATEQLGLAVPEFQDVELGPVVVQAVKTGAGKVAGTRELLVSASAVNRIVGSQAFAAASVLFAAAYGVLVDGVLLELISATGQETGGMPYVYRLTVRVPAALAV